MKIEKVYNNNVVLVKSDNDEEIIIMGKGLGFQKKTGDEVESSQIEKRFILQNADIVDELTRVFVDLSPEETEVVLEIIEHGQKILKTNFDIALYISLADHLHYTYQRIADNVVLQNPLTWEIRKFFPEEFQVGRDALKIVFEKMSLILPDDEVASIALHFVNAQKD